MTELRTGRRKYYDIFSHFYDWFIRMHSRSDKQESRGLLVNSAGLENMAAPRVLDVCCGTGSVVLNFADHFSDILAVGYDFSHGMLQKAAEKDTFHRLTLIEGDAARLPFERDSFDAVCCSHALYELKGAVRDHALLEMKRVVKADGRVLIMEHEVPKKRFIKILFYIRMMIIGSKNSREFLNQGTSPFKQIFPSVTVSHTRSQKSKLMICRK